MTLDEHLDAEASQTDSMFRAVLAREDIDRLAKLRQMAGAATDAETFAKDALFVGWTAGDLRSRELAPAVAAFAKAIWEEARGAISNDALFAAWQSFHAERMRVLIHCL